MLNYQTKIDNDETSAGVVVAQEYNSIMQEQKNTVTPFFTPNELDNQQQVKAIDIMSKALFYTDVGSVNAVQLTRGATSQTLETLFDGMVIIFTPANANTGATTLKVKTLDTKPLKYNGADLVAGYLKIGYKYIAIYDLANDRFDVDTLANYFGLATQVFKVANAVNSDEAVALGQLSDAISEKGTFTFTSDGLDKTGYYVKIDKMVWFSVDVAGATGMSFNDGTGLPFEAKYNTPITIGRSKFTDVIDADGKTINAYIPANSVNINYRTTESADEDDASFTVTTHSSGTTSTLYLTGVYECK